MEDNLRKLAITVNCVRLFCSAYLERECLGIYLFDNLYRTNSPGKCVIGKI